MSWAEHWWLYIFINNFNNHKDLEIATEDSKTTAVYKIYGWDGLENLTATCTCI